MTTDTVRSPYAVCFSPVLGSVRWTTGFWAQKTRYCAEKMIPHMASLLRDPILCHAWANFRIAAGEAEGTHSGPAFHDGDFYKWLEAASFSLAFHPNEELGLFIDEAIALIARVQEPSGYIFTKRAIERRGKENAATPLADELNFEVYNLGHLITAACAHFRATGKRTLLAVAEKAADYLDGVFSAVSADKAKTAVCPSHYMALAELYRTTGDRRHLALCERLIALRDEVRNGTDDNQDRLPLRDHREALGHAVRANYLYAGLADLYAETGNPEYLPVLESVWEDVHFRKLYLTGSCGALYDGVSPYGSWDYPNIQRTHQAYGRAYQLPNVTAYNETCAAIGWFLWNWRMFLVRGEARFIDAMERSLLNGILSGISLDGERYFYTNALSRAASLPFDLKWSRSREKYITSFCCPPNLVRTLAETVSYAYAVAGDEIKALLFGGNHASLTLQNGTRVELEQKSAYPHDGKIEFAILKIEGSDVFALSPRIPLWAQGATLSVNGLTVSTVQAEGPLEFGYFAPVRRRWKEGDRAELTLPMATRVIEAHPLVEETRGHVAFTRGPLVYCLETADLPAGISIGDVLVPRDASFESVEAEIAGERIIALEGNLFARPSRDWGKALYADYDPTPPAVFTARLVPYYAWDNRGFGEMAVWLPLA